MIRYQITDGTVPPSATADFIQIRNAALSARELAALVRSVLDLKLPGRVIVNDRLDVALATGAAGVHLKSNGLYAATVRAFVPEGFFITVACHSEADVAGATGADFALLSPVFDPRSKPARFPAPGLEAFARIAANSKVPILALGGITDDNAGICIEAGAVGVAGISLFQPC